jgi:hypothetical protein
MDLLQSIIIWWRTEMDAADLGTDNGSQGRANQCHCVIRQRACIRDGSGLAGLLGPMAQSFHHRQEIRNGYRVESIE